MNDEELHNSSMLDLFRHELEKHFPAIKNGLLELEQGKPSLECLESLMRAAYSIKGAARMVGVNEVDGINLDENDIDRLLKSIDLIIQFSDSKEPPEKWMADHQNEYNELLVRLKVLMAADEILVEKAASKSISSLKVSNLLPNDKGGVSDTSMLELFRSEFEEHGRILNSGLLELEQCQSSHKCLEALMHAAHSIKSAARLVGLSEVVEVAHLMEDCFATAQADKINLNTNDINILLNSLDLIGQISGSKKPADKWVAEHRCKYDELLRRLRTLAVESKVLEETVTPESMQPLEIPRLESNSISNELSQSDSSMLELFQLEVEEHSRILNNGLLELEQGKSSDKCLEALMRAAHSIKGAARMVGLNEVVEVAHLMEDCFVVLQENGATLAAEDIDVLFKSIDMISMHLQTSESKWLDNNKKEYESLLISLQGVRQKLVSNEQCHSPELIQAKSEDIPSEQEIKIVQPLPKKVDVSSSEATDEDTDELASVLRVSTAQINRLMGLTGESIVRARWLRPYVDSMSRLKQHHVKLAQRLDVLWSVVGNITNDEKVYELLRDIQNREVECRRELADRIAAMEEYDRHATNLSSRLHQAVVTSRMRPFADGVEGFPRMVRDVARSLNKSVQLEIEGKATKLDRDILEKIEAPLNHLLRNAVDHGIEMPEVRKASGKPEKGVIRLSAFHQAGMLSIVIEDDGGGIDIESLRAKVLQKGMVDESMAKNLSEAELYEFLFLPGFSTKQDVTEISGRGVGMDVVHEVVQKMRGQVRVSSHLGKGTRFHMQLPLTLSVIPCLLVYVSEEPYAFPLARIKQIFEEDKSAIEEIEGHQFINVEGRSVGVISMAQLLELSGDLISNKETVSVVVLGEKKSAYGLVVDSFIGKRDLVVQQMPGQLRKIKDISAAALMEDGSPILIVDVDDILCSINKIVNSGQVNAISAEHREIDQHLIKRILVIDDSITVREVERNLLLASGYHVDVAVDGMDGWNMVNQGNYDLVITDIDMPRMDGIEFVNYIKGNSNTAHIPVIVVSYKDREEDRLRGLEAGADYYLTKGSFHDHSLQEAVRDLIGEALVTA
ncbi:MAG TPA: response regulator [Crenotrichaceae bacterium]|nr:response regulator [Crenotrichaceae bacterium]